MRKQNSSSEEARRLPIDVVGNILAFHAGSQGSIP